MTHARADELARARDYPYDRPGASYVLFEGDVLALRQYNIDDMDQRTGVLAYGSNGSPSQLKRKFAATLADELIPVLKAYLPGFDVVFAARLSRYGAIPATLARSKDTVLETFVMYLTDGQLARMHETEIDTGKRGGYRYGVLGGRRFRGDSRCPVARAAGLHMLVDRVGLLENVKVYHYGRALARDEQPLAYAEIKAKDRVLPEQSHAAVLAETHGAADEAALTAAILEAIDDPQARSAHVARLRENSIEVRLPRFKKILP